MLPRKIEQIEFLGSASVVGASVTFRLPDNGQDAFIRLHSIAFTVDGAGFAAASQCTLEVKRKDGQPVFVVYADLVAAHDGAVTFARDASKANFLNCSVCGLPQGLVPEGALFTITCNSGDSGTIGNGLAYYERVLNNSDVKL
jgi:hypothetical protein